MRARLLVGLSLLLVSSAARADAPARALVRALGPSAKVLADASGRVPILARLPDGADARALGLLPVAPGFGAVRLAPDHVDAFASAHPDLALAVAPPRRPLLDVSGQWTQVQKYRKTTGFTGKGVVVGVIDTGLDVRHPDFLDAQGKSRVRWMLAAGAATGVHADLEAKYGCADPTQGACAIYSNEDIDAMIAKGAVTLRDGDGHGTHVTSIAAGNGGVSKHKNPTYVGMAPDAILVVAAPEPPGGGFYDPDILNAARFIFDRADELGLPCVINLSIGGDFGPHDGTSGIESGLAALVGDDKPGHVIVVAAGNSGSLYTINGVGPYGAHTEAHVSPSSEVRVPILASQAKSGQGYVWVTFHQGDEMSVALEGPGGKTWVGYTSAGHDSGYNKDGNTGGVINAEVSNKSPLLAGQNSAVVAFSGAWGDQSEFAVKLKGHGDASLWVTGEGDVGPSASIGLLFERALRQGTINVPASDPHLLAVGCTLNRVEWQPFTGPPLALSSLGGVDGPTPDGSCYFSAAGPNAIGTPKPEISAPGGFVAAAMSIDADPRKNPGGLFDPGGCPDDTKCYVVDDEHAIAIGTSMSSPHVAGAVALLLEADRTLTQSRVTAVLQAGAHRPTGLAPFDYQIGPGELDLEGARAALASEMANGFAADVATSWYSLSAAYARADTSFPVWGTIELRHKDGTIASGIDASALSLVTRNAVVVRPLEKVRHGLFRFAVAATPGTVGQKLGIEVFYGGASLGARELPIGPDAWEATGSIDAVGGCSIAPARDDDRSGVLAVAGLAALALVTSSRPKGSTRACRRRRSPGR